MEGACGGHMLDEIENNQFWTSSFLNRLGEVPCHKNYRQHNKFT